MTGTLWRSTSSWVLVLASAGFPPVFFSDQLDLSPSDHPISLAKKKAGTFFLLLAARGKWPGENCQKADFQRPWRLREEPRCRKGANQSARLEHHTPREFRYNFPR